MLCQRKFVYCPFIFHAVAEPLGYFYWLLKQHLFSYIFYNLEKIMFDKNCKLTDIGLLIYCLSVVLSCTIKFI